MNVEASAIWRGSAPHVGGRSPRAKARTAARTRGGARYLKVDGRDELKARARTAARARGPKARARTAAKARGTEEEKA